MITLHCLFPSSISYSFEVILWCDVQLTQDAAGICFPYLTLNNSTGIPQSYETSTYSVNGVPISGHFTIDFTLKGLANVYLTQGIYSRSNAFDGISPLLTVESVFLQNSPPGFWLNIQHDAFFSSHNLSMRTFVLGVSKTVIISYISSPEVKFLQGIAKAFAATKTKIIFRFLGQSLLEPTTNQTYGSLLQNLTFIKTFASGILVPKTYIWPVDSGNYLQRHTSVVTDAHTAGLQVFGADFSNDNVLAYNYSYNPVAEYLSVIDNGEFCVDGVLSDFPITPSEAIDDLLDTDVDLVFHTTECYAHLGENASVQANALVISHNGASGDYPGCTDIAYAQAIADGADVIDCNVQMSKDGVPFCLSSINLIASTTIAQSTFSTLETRISQLQRNHGIFSFSLTWSEIQGLTPAISNPYANFLLYRNPLFKNAGKLMSLSDFLALAQNATTISGVLVNIENALYLAEVQGLGVTDAVLNALQKAGYSNKTAKKVLIQSYDRSVLEKFKGKNYELVWDY
ncbi:Glycerophosphodiester phosphodiesterase GDPDL3-like protein [Drosera capensis]